MINQLEYSKNLIIGAANTAINPIRKSNEKTYYNDHIFRSGPYIEHNRFDNTGESLSYIMKGTCYVFSMGNQYKMIKNGWLRKTFFNEYRNWDVLEEWLKDNIKGFYDIRGWGNGIANYKQLHYGLWHIEVYLMREEDAVAFKLRWS